MLLKKPNQNKEILKSIYFLLIIAVVFSMFSCDKTTYKNASLLVEDNCIVIGSLTIEKNTNDVWELKNNDEHLYYYPNFEEAKNTKAILDHYQTTQVCICGDGSYTNSDGEEIRINNIMQYQLTEDYTGIGNNEMNSYQNPVEDCLPFNPEKLVARKSLDGKWYLIERPGHSMFSFGNDEDACKKALSVIKKYEFNQSCFVGRANASFNYLKRYREDIDTLRSFN
tara:strand:- start:112 stop:786 length:675 start_codon:yes stop_codon:yes gene_type:complete